MDEEKITENSLSNFDRLCLRIKILEQELAEARTAKSEAETKLTHDASSSPQHPHPEHSHHAAENMRLFGKSDGVVFLEPQARERTFTEECMQIVQESKGIFGAYLRFFTKYNIDQFASRPILHQWIQNGKVYREAKSHQSSHFELFFDLLFVGIIHQVSDAAAEQPDGIGLARYVLTFCPAYSIWTDVRDTVNQFGTDDVSERLYILWIMLLLVGYSNNASSIDLGTSSSEDDVSSTSGPAIQWALGFYLVAKFSKVLLNTAYGFHLPLSRKSLLASSFGISISSLFFLLAIFLPLHAQISLVAVGISVELGLKFVAMLLIKLVERGQKCLRNRNTSSDAVSPNEGSLASRSDTLGSEGPSRSDTFGSFSSRSDTVGSEDKFATNLVNKSSTFASLVTSTKTQRMPAVNIEHHVERLGAFVTIVLGEMVANIFFKNSIATGLNLEAGRSFLALLLAFNLNWLYFDSEACREFIHALRRHWLTSGLFTYIHLPLMMALLLASSVVNQLVINDDISVGLKFFFGGGIGISVICMCTIGILHKRLDKHRGALGIGRGFIFGTRYAVAIAMALLPFAQERLNSVQFLGVYVALTAFLIAEETIARLEERPS